MSLCYGVTLPQGWTWDLVNITDAIQAYETMTSVAQAAEECGYESIWLIDHFQPISQPPQAMAFECWTSTAALARDTRRVRIGQAVTSSSFRHPALLAKMASTVDVLSHGRLTVGIGAGRYEPEYRAYGYPYPEASERLHQLREAIEIILSMWKEEEATFEGTSYQVHGAINQPKGIQQPHIPLLIGGNGEQVTLKLVAQYGDACNVFGDPGTVARKFAVLKGHCDAVQRDYESIRRSVSVVCVIADSDAQAQARAPEWLQDQLDIGLVGSPETIRARLAAYEAAGVQEMIISFLDTSLDSTRRFAREFIT